MSDSRMVLQKLGGSYQLVIEKPEDLEKVARLDEALWMATSVPAESLTCDPSFLHYVDYDSNGRMRSDELRAAVAWTLRMLSDRSRMLEPVTALSLDSIDGSHDDGKALRAAATQMLTNIGAGDSAEISLDQVRDRKKLLASGATNGDGVIPPDAIDDDGLAAFMKDVIATQGGVADASGPEGVDEEHLKSFLSEARDYLAWSELGGLPEGSDATGVMAWGTDTPAAGAALSAVRDKIDEYFSLCRLARIDGRVAEKARLSEAELGELDTGDVAAIDELTSSAPLAVPGTDEALYLDDRINPAWRGRVAELEQKVLVRALGPGAGRLSRAEWEHIKAEFAGYDKWLTEKKGASVEKLGCEKLNGYLEGEGDGEFARLLGELIARDKEVADELERVQSVEKLILCQRWLMELANNFVAFPALYDPDRISLVEQGTLVLDGRRFTLCVKVTDRAAHKLVARHSHICLLYVEVSGKDKGAEKFEVGAAVTRGNMRLLCTGKRGVFFSADGTEWDAKIVDVLEAPVSLWEAVKYPFRKLADFAGKQIGRITSSGYDKLETGLGKGLDQAGKSITAPPPPAPSKSGGMGMGLMLMGGGLSVAALGSALAFITRTLAEVKLSSVALVLIGLAAAVAVPTVVVAFFKLRRRNISMVLEACGWAVNAEMRLTRSMGMIFTHRPGMPEGASMRRHDMIGAFAGKLPGEAHQGLKWIGGVLLAAAIGAAAGWLVCEHVGLGSMLYDYLLPR